MLQAVHTRIEYSNFYFLLRCFLLVPSQYLSWKEQNKVHERLHCISYYNFSFKELLPPWHFLFFLCFPFEHSFQLSDSLQYTISFLNSFLNLSETSIHLGQVGKGSSSYHSDFHDQEKIAIW